jgi:hypothetical protein
MKTSLLQTPIGAKSFPTSSKNLRAGYLRRHVVARLAMGWTERA